MSLLEHERSQLVKLQRIVAPELKRFEDELAGVMSGGSPLVREICDHLQRGRSKRFRPTLLLLAARHAGGIDERAILAAACAELVHTATLVHDDSIDEASTRRGLPSINHAWGSTAALIMGDYLFARAIDTLCERGLDEAVHHLVRTTLLMSQAEMMQLELRRDLSTTEGQYLRIIEYKTASLIQAVCDIGASFNPEVDGCRASLGEFGRKVGLVFQITDDVFDFQGDERRLGKPTGLDWEEGRITLPLIAALRRAPDAARAEFVTEVSARPGQVWREHWPRVKSFVVAHGGVDYALGLARRFGEEAKSQLEPLPAGQQRELLVVAAEYVINRIH
jgi:octaprenyl-diphosphate synthase